MIYIYVCLTGLIVSTAMMIHQLFQGVEWTREEMAKRREEERKGLERPDTRYERFSGVITGRQLRKITRQVMENDRRQVWR